VRDVVQEAYLLEGGRGGGSEGRRLQAKDVVVRRDSGNLGTFKIILRI
jgi:hypothetical protein